MTWRASEELGVQSGKRWAVERPGSGRSRRWAGMTEEQLGAVGVSWERPGSVYTVSVNVP